MGPRHRGKSILKGILALVAIAVFAYLYSLISEPTPAPAEKNVRHPPPDIGKLHFTFACFLLLLVGMPILR